MSPHGHGPGIPRLGDRTRYGDTNSRGITFFAVVGNLFGKVEITRTLPGEEPMVTLDAAAITERIGRISHPEPTKPPIYQARPNPMQQTEAKWRRALRPRPVS
jgi:hypothetical protein